MKYEIREGGGFSAIIIFFSFNFIFTGQPHLPWKNIFHFSCKKMDKNRKLTTQFYIYLSDVWIKCI